MTLDSVAIASGWLSLCTSALCSGGSHAAVNIFLPDGWLRDVLVFTWDIRSLEGHDKIASYLWQYLQQAGISNLKLDMSSDLAPREFILPQIQAAGIELAFTFACRHGCGRGYARLLRDSDGTFRAFTLLTELADLIGHEEFSTLLFKDDAHKSWDRAIPHMELNAGFDKWKHSVQTNPYVLIVGAGQTGLNVAARFKQMAIPSLVIERHSRIGDVWRERYPALTLHTTRKHHSLLYQPYPSNWPQFTPRDKLADWFECYAVLQDLIVWTNTVIKEPPTYDRASRLWDVIVIRDGVEVKFRPSHIVLATGTLGKPFIPDVANIGDFRGEVLHSGDFKGGAKYAGKRVVVVGAGNSSIDICQDLVLNGSRSVSMIQRSVTCVISRGWERDLFKVGFPDDVPLEVVDFRWASTPSALFKKLSIANLPAAEEYHKELHAKLRKGGLQVNLGPEGQGTYVLYLERSGGYWIDKGAADMIEDGRIRVYSSVKPKRFFEEEIVLDDDFKLAADAVVFATGYTRIRETTKELLGEDIVSQIDEVYGMDDEGEIKGSYRPCGYPGLWFATGDFNHSRTLSKALALQIKAIQLGLLDHDGKRDGAVDKYRKCSL